MMELFPNHITSFLCTNAYSSRNMMKHNYKYSKPTGINIIFSRSFLRYGTGNGCKDSIDFVLVIKAVPSHEALPHYKLD